MRLVIWVAFMVLILGIHVTIALGQTATTVPARIAVVTSSSVPAYAEALEGLKKGLEDLSASIELLDLDREGIRDTFEETLRERSNALVICIGSDAHRIASRAGAAAPFITTMILGGMTIANEQSAGRERLVGAVTLETAISTIALNLAALFPDMKRLGILLGPESGIRREPELRAEAQRAGFTLRVARAAGPAALLEAFHTLEGDVDFVWCLPDEALYTAATVKPLLMASLRSRLPLIGFSASFARAGAAIAFYPDYADVGVQTAKMARRYVASRQRQSWETPRKTMVAVNQRVLRILGLRAEVANREPETLLVLK
ncbi:MAG: hypothetical protein KIT09_30100 [Bryobacteraceae bacterium]|nr:hypothetical protein [Bryobacteraceae bacterium]